MVEEHEEIETKYELTPQTALPPLSALLRELPGAVEAGLRAGDHRELALEAVYFDTADLRLSAAKATLRRRTGGEDAGWHLKTPGSNGARLERQVPLGRAVRTVPVALRRLIEDLTAGEQLVPVAQVNTRRLVQTVLDAQSRQVLEFADDSVEARRLLPSGVAGEARDARQVWREAELELVDGDRAVFDLVDAALRSAGLTVSTSSSKLARVLGAEPAPSPAPSPEPSPVAEPAPPRAAVAPRTLSPRASATRKGLSVKSSAGDVLLVHLREQVGQIFDQDARVRADEAESVHRMRVATRRLRSALQTFQPLLASSSKPLRDELRWLAAELGKARDAEVLRDRLVQAVTSLDSPVEDQPRSPVEDQLTVQVAEQLGSAYRRAHDEVLAGLDSERY
ncbi:MAG: CHAD domain-containing protein, partial [Janthinobacterium lividum]